MIVLLRGPSIYYCKEDEDHFFQWLGAIPAFQNVRGTPNGLELSVSEPIDRDSLYTLIGLLTRYGVNPRPLAALSHPGLENWFKGKNTYWHQAIFGDVDKT